ncbi:hypothetical protease [Moritella sp. PE36]|uniref:HK97 family phage prohead protease n=1 Tax=Moritella sp. PE36 TaxID=58051 RepID=UPI000156914E|nr:HK97 family phage prohead protease [Moritella sp. PE36]EDM66149.1 hypothetical protease [Moritella sp. PE36]
MQNKYLQVGFDVKYIDQESMTFSAYGNTKNFVDHAKDETQNNAYQKSIQNHIEKGTMPQLLWSHDGREMPVGVITGMKEDERGLMFKGKLSKTTAGLDLYELMKDGAVNSFSIGYTVQKEEFDREKGINKLIEIDIKEISACNFPCNEESVLIDIKSNEDLPTQREVQDLLQYKCGYSKRTAEKIMNQFSNKSANDDNDELNSILQKFTSK